MPKYKFKNHHTTSPADVQTGDAFAIKVVATTGFDHDWAAYVGPSCWDKQRVADEGDKLLREQAEPLFYALKRSGRHYRE